MLKTIALLFAALIASAPALADDDEVSTTATNNVIKKCAGGRVIGIEGQVSGELTKFFKGARAQGQGKVSDLGAIIDKLKPDAVGVEFYREYTRCISDQTAKELERLRIPSDKKLSDIKTQSSARKIDWPQSPFGAGIALRRIRVARSYETVVTLFDASCAITVWLPLWVWPIDRSGEPTIKIEPTASAVTARSYPFQVKFTRDGGAVNDAGTATREEPDIELGGPQGRTAFLKYALSNPDEIDVYLAIRARGVNGQCGGAMAIEQLPRS